LNDEYLCTQTVAVGILLMKVARNEDIYLAMKFKAVPRVVAKVDAV